MGQRRCLSDLRILITGASQGIGRALAVEAARRGARVLAAARNEALRAEVAKDGIDVIVVCPGLTQTNFSKNMLEQKAKMQLDHMRGMTSEEAARATLKALAKGRDETVLTFKGKLVVWVSRFFPR